MENMHQDFGDWYRAKSIEPNSDSLPKRWAGVLAFQNASGDDITELAKLFYGLGKPDEKFLAAFRKAFQDKDPAFPMKANDQELVVLAGASLVDRMEGYVQPNACMAALALVSAAGQNLRKAPPIADIVQKAVKFLNESAANRLNESEGDEKLEAQKAACAKVKAQGEPWPDFATAMESIIDENHALRQQVPLIAEESNMLWWLFSEYSRELKQPLTDLETPVCALVIGKELADLTLALPGPVAAPAFLDKAIRRNSKKAVSKIEVKQALAGTPLEWRQKVGGQSLPPALLELTPITNGIRVSVSAPGESWVAAFEQSVGFAATAKINPHELAYQVYLECLLYRAWAALK